MSDIIYKLEGTGTGGATSNDVVSVDIQNDGLIEGVWVQVTATGMDALNDNCRAEVSFLSTNTFGTNDTRGSILIVSAFQSFLTSGGGLSGGQGFVTFAKGIPVVAGERIHCHTTGSTGVTPTVTAFLYVRTTSNARSSGRRR